MSSRKKKNKTVARVAEGISKKTDIIMKKESREKAETMTGVELITKLTEEEKNALYVLDRDESGHVFSDLEKKFISNWVEFKNLVVVSSMIGVSQKESSIMLGDCHIRSEIDRITRARVKFRFARRMMTLDECESYLTTAITDEGVALADQLNSRDKLSAMKLLLDVKEMKAQGIANPTVIDNMPEEQTLEKLSVDTIKALRSTLLSKKEDIADNISMRQELVSLIPNLSEEDKNDLMTASPDELMKVLDGIDK